MSYKNLLVHLDNDGRCAERIGIAAKLAVDFEAQLAGLYLVQQPRIPGAVRAALGDDFFREQHDAWRHNQVTRMQSQFSGQAARAGVAAAEFRESGDNADATIAMHARYADLLVLGQDDPREQYSMVEPGFPGRTMLASGRPVLIIPYAGGFTEIGRRILVPWNASREAARAVIDALPFLLRADKVMVLAVNPMKTADHGEMPGADIGLFLARHGVRVEAGDHMADDIDVAQWLLSRACDLDTDLMVMGGYGHSRLREMAFGGVTHSILANMTVPVLMSH
jgi:nucleotide-binding universal stress UspA family protein